MKTQNDRGILTEAIQEKARAFLGEEITVKELRLYPFLDYCWKNGGRIQRGKTDLEEKKILERREKQGHCETTYIGENKPTREFYNFVNDILAEAYVVIKNEVTENE